MSEETSSFIAPAGLLERVRKLSQIYKQTVRILPVQQGNVVNGNQILLQFPVDSVFDLLFESVLDLFRQVGLLKASIIDLLRTLGFL